MKASLTHDKAQEGREIKWGNTFIIYFEFFSPSSSFLRFDSDFISYPISAPSLPPIHLLPIPVFSHPSVSNVLLRTKKKTACLLPLFSWRPPPSPSFAHSYSGPRLPSKILYFIMSGAQDCDWWLGRRVQDFPFMPSPIYKATMLSTECERGSRFASSALSFWPKTPICLSNRTFFSFQTPFINHSATSSSMYPLSHAYPYNPPGPHHRPSSPFVIYPEATLVSS